MAQRLQFNMCFAFHHSHILTAQRGIVRARHATRKTLISTRQKPFGIRHSKIGWVGLGGVGWSGVVLKQTTNFKVSFHLRAICQKSFENSMILPAALSGRFIFVDELVW